MEFRTRSSARPFFWAALAGLVAVVLLAACSSSGSSTAAAPASTAASGTSSMAATADTIVIKNFMFSPMSMTVAPGAMVTVRNEDTVTHTLTAKSGTGSFNTGDIPAGQSKSFKAPNKAGSYAYICTIHQYMNGTLIVS